MNIIKLVSFSLLLSSTALTSAFAMNGEEMETSCDEEANTRNVRPRIQSQEITGVVVLPQDVLENIVIQSASPSFMTVCKRFYTMVTGYSDKRIGLTGLGEDKHPDVPSMISLKYEDRPMLTLNYLGKEKVPTFCVSTTKKVEYKLHEIPMSFYSAGGYIKPPTDAYGQEIFPMISSYSSHKDKPTLTVHFSENMWEPAIYRGKTTKKVEYKIDEIPSSLWYVFLKGVEKLGPLHVNFLEGSQVREFAFRDISETVFSDIMGRLGPILPKTQLDTLVFKKKSLDWHTTLSAAKSIKKVDMHKVTGRKYMNLGLKNTDVDEVIYPKDFEVDDIRTELSSLEGSKVTRVHFSHSPFGGSTDFREDDVKEMSDLLKKTKITELSFIYCGLDREDITNLITIFSKENPEITKLNLWDNLNPWDDNTKALAQLSTPRLEIVVYNPRPIEEEEERHSDSESMEESHDESEESEDGKDNKGVSQEDEEMDGSEESEDTMEGAMQKYFPSMFQ